MLDAALDLFLAVGLAAPAMDLGPAGDARLDPMAREIAVHRLVVEMLGGLGVDGVRPRPDQRQVAGENDVEELRQLVEAGLADEAADPGDTLVILVDLLGGVGVGVLDIERAKLVDLDELVVEAMAPLLEEDRSLAVELDGERDQAA